MKWSGSTWKGIVVLVRDGWIIDGIAPVETLEDFQAERTRLQAEADYNAKRYDGSWRVSFLPDATMDEFDDYETAVGFNG